MKKSRETVFENSYMNFINSVKEKELCEMKDIVKLTKIMQDNEMDCFIVFAGQNGTGKSMANLMFCKLHNPKEFMNNYFLADKTSDDIVDYYLFNEKTCLGIDELNQYLYYKQHASNEQNHLITQMELSRSQEVITTGCIRDPRKLTLNFRDGKMSILIWLIDRFKDKSGSYGVVLVGNPSLEGEDRFGIDWLRIETPDFEDMRAQLENLPSFIGYIKIPNAYEVLSKEEITNYRQLKKKAMAHADLNYCIKKVKSKKMDLDEFYKKVEKFKVVLGAEIVDSKIHGLDKKSTLLKHFLGEDEE